MDYQTVFSPDGKVVTNWYLYTGTDMAADTKIMIRRTYTGPKGTMRIELSVEAQELVDNGIDAPIYNPVKFFIGFEIGIGQRFHDLTAFSKAMGFVYSLTFLTVNTKVPSTAVLSALLLGVVDPLN